MGFCRLNDSKIGDIFEAVFGYLQQLSNRNLPLPEGATPLWQALDKFILSTMRTVHFLEHTGTFFTSDTMPELIPQTVLPHEVIGRWPQHFGHANRTAA